MNPETQSATQAPPELCEYCNGKGILTQEGPVCPKCGGSGSIYASQSSALPIADPATVFRRIPRERHHAKRGIGFTSKNKEESKSRRKMAKASRKKNR